MRTVGTFTIKFNIDGAACQYCHGNCFFALCIYNTFMRWQVYSQDSPRIIQYLTYRLGLLQVANPSSPCLMWQNTSLHDGRMCSEFINTKTTFTVVVVFQTISLCCAYFKKYRTFLCWHFCVKWPGFCLTVKSPDEKLPYLPPFNVEEQNTLNQIRIRNFGPIVDPDPEFWHNCESGSRILAQLRIRITFDSFFQKNFIFPFFRTELLAHIIYIFQ